MDGSLVNNVFVCVGSLMVCVQNELLAPTVCENFQTIGQPY